MCNLAEGISPGKETLGGKSPSGGSLGGNSYLRSGQWHKALRGRFSDLMPTGLVILIYKGLVNVHVFLVHGGVRTRRDSWL